jgi:hypothetical protein
MSLSADAQVVDVESYLDFTDGRTAVYYPWHALTVIPLGENLKGEVISYPAILPGVWTPSDVVIWSFEQDGHSQLGVYSLSMQEFLQRFDPPLGPFGGLMEVGQSTVVQTYEQISGEFWTVEDTLLAAGFSFTTPAGTFDDCILVVDEFSIMPSAQVYSNFWVCARDVGPILGFTVSEGIVTFGSILVHFISPA